jgi:flagellar assembly protein FliH
MGDIQKFLFDRRFDRGGGFDEDEDLPFTTAPVEVEPPPEPEEPPPPPPPMFTAAQMEAAREEGYIGGHTAALDEASAATERLTALALGEVGRRLDGLTHRHEIAVDALARDATRLILAVCRKVLPATAEKNAVREITALVAELLPNVLDEPRLVVRVNPDVADVLRERMDPVIAESGYEGRVLVTPDGRVPQADCRIDWGEGGLERDTARQWAEIEALIDQHLAGPMREVTPAAPPPPDVLLARRNAQPPEDDRSALDDLPIDRPLDGGMTEPPQGE